MTYLRVRWIHRHPTEPVLLVSELDDERYETRKLEISRDGRVGYADADESVGGAELGDRPTPSLEEIAADEEFEPEEIAPEEFERIWAMRKF